MKKPHIRCYEWSGTWYFLLPNGVVYRIEHDQKENNWTTMFDSPNYVPFLFF